MQRTLRIIYASTSGHTEFVCDTLKDHMQKKDSTVVVTMMRAEKATPEDLVKDDLTVLASGSWNTGSIEGQLNPYMHEFLTKRAKDVDLKKHPFVIIALGDHRYFYTARANEHFAQFIMHQDGTQAIPPLTIVNEPYDQTDRIEKFGDELLKKLKSLTVNAE